MYMYNNHLDIYLKHNMANQLYFKFFLKVAFEGKKRKHREKF